MALLRVEEAVARVMATVPDVVPESVPLELAYGRVLVESVVAPVAVPPWDNAAMDGYALRLAEPLGTGEVATFWLTETIGAGSVGQTLADPRRCAAIMTGAPVPQGATAVVMVEQTERQGSEIRVRGPVQVGDHIRRRGEDVLPGDRVLLSGRTVTPGAVAVAASLGLDRLKVGKRPVVALLSTGDELIPPGQVLGPGQIFASNDVALAGQVRDSGGIARRVGVARDNLASLLEHLEHASRSDVVVTTGGVSVGEFDYVKEAFQTLGADIEFWKVAIKPGKPFAFGVLRAGGREVPLFGLPGNPVSCMVNFLQFVRPWLLAAQGHASPYPPFIDAFAGEPLRGKPGRLRLDRVRLVRDGARWLAFGASDQGSAILAGMAHGHGLAVLEEDVGTLPAGAPVRVQIFDTSFLDGTEPSWRIGR